MPSTQALYARHRDPSGTLVRQVGGVQPEAGLTVEAALASLAEIAERPSFDLAGAPGEGDVLAYALALMRLRDSAHAADCMRLMRACDALSVTVARLLEHCNQPHCEQCAALRRFVVHAQAMLHLPAEYAEPARTH